MTDTDRMVVWLRETLDAAQRDAEAAARAFPEWDYDEFVKEIRDVPNAGTVAFIAVTEYGPHIARHDPAAVLRRIAKDRERLEDCENILAGWHYEETKELAANTIRNIAECWGWTEEEPR
ncbi:MAG: hypothetical protein HOY76_19695 [Streptomyces sp.]|nr:hypothetical protein [Streptomyces sp.]